MIDHHLKGTFLKKEEEKKNPHDRQKCTVITAIFLGADIIMC